MDPTRGGQTSTPSLHHPRLTLSSLTKRCVKPPNGLTGASSPLLIDPTVSTPPWGSPRPRLLPHPTPPEPHNQSGLTPISTGSTQSSWPPCQGAANLAPPLPLSTPCPLLPLGPSGPFPLPMDPRLPLPAILTTLVAVKCLSSSLEPKANFLFPTLPCAARPAAFPAVQRAFPELRR